MTDEPLLLTPGPLTTSRKTKNAMLRDWGSRDAEFIKLTCEISQKLEKIAGVDQEAPTHDCVLVQGSGTFAVEAVIDTLIPKEARVLILVNGEYGRRMAEICRVHKLSHSILETGEDRSPSGEQVTRFLNKDKSITHVLAVHCETTSGILNPISEIAEAVAAEGCLFIIDAMSSFGALPLSVKKVKCAAIIASSNKCLEGVPGVGFAIIEKNILANSGENATSVSLDLFDQWQNFNKTGQWRFTPPTHVLAAFRQALIEHEAEGGVEARGKRYNENCSILMEGMRALGFKSYLPSDMQAPIIATFFQPDSESFEFIEFYNKLNERGFMIYSGKLTQVDSFRIGCIGHLKKENFIKFLEAVTEVIGEMGLEL